MVRLEVGALLLNILKHPDERLRTIAEPVSEVDNDIRWIVDSMFMTMDKADGIGLAATQVDIHQRIAVLDVNGKRFAMINPVITSKSKKKAGISEGCLSVPAHKGLVMRPKNVSVEFLDRNGEEQVVHAAGLLATCIQHEVDHLDGILFTDYSGKTGVSNG